MLLEQKQSALISSVLLNKMAADISKGKTVQLNITKEYNVEAYLDVLRDLSGLNLIHAPVYCKFVRVCKETLEITTINKFYGVNIKRS